MPLNLLVADDSATIHKVVGLAFEGEDVTVLTAKSGQEALNRVNENKPDIIFADTEMPELNGFELCQKIKENENLKKIPVCLIHSDFEEFDEGKYRACGADDHIAKPFKSEDIVNKVTEMTGGSGKEKKDEPALTNDTSGKENMPSKEISQEDLEELEILPLDDVEEEVQENEAAIELKLENAVDEPAVENEISMEVPTENELGNFMEEIETENEAEENDIKKELDEFNEALDIPDEELGEAEPFIIEEEKTEISEKPDTVDEIESAIPALEENVETEEITPELKLTENEIKEEKEDLIEDTGILPDTEIETPEIKKADIKTALKEDSQISQEDFEKLIGGYIKQIIEKTLKEAIQGEIGAITDKIIEAVERIAREITPGISRTIIQKEIEKIKNPEA